MSRDPHADEPGKVGWEPGKKVEGPKAPISREVSAKIRNRIRACLVGETVAKRDADGSGTLDTEELTDLGKEFSKRRGDITPGGEAAGSAVALAIARGREGDDRTRRGAVVADAVEILPNHAHLMDLFVHLLSRVIDPENFYWTCFSRLPPHLHVRFLHRVGWLNILDCMNPHARFELDFTHLDHWKVGHILTQLAATEEGVNFVNPSFQRSADDPPIPGWDLPTTWDVKRYTGNLQKGVPRCGLLKVDYTCLPENENLDERHDLARRFTLSGMPRPETDPVESAAFNQPLASSKVAGVSQTTTKTQDRHKSANVPGVLRS